MSIGEGPATSVLMAHQAESVAVPSFAKENVAIGGKTACAPTDYLAAIAER